MVLRALIAAGLGVSLVLAEAAGGSIVVRTTGASLAPDSIAWIDPTTGSSVGTEGSELRVGDILALLWTLASLPADSLRGVQSRLTVYVPSGTELVGARLVGPDGATAAPTRAGLADRVGGLQPSDERTVRPRGLTSLESPRSGAAEAVSSSSDDAR